MSYSAFFTAGLHLASQPRTSDGQNVPPQPLSSVHTRSRRRQSSLSIATAPLVAIKPPLHTAVEMERTPFKNPTPRSASSHEPSMSPRTRPFLRRKTVSNGQDLPILPAPTSPLPPPPVPALPSHLITSASATTTFTRKRQNSTATSGDKLSSPVEEPFPSSPIATTDPVLPPSIASATPKLGSLRSNPARRSSSALPPFSVVRGLFTPSPMGNTDSVLVDERGHLLVGQQN